jgi:hypothetical protein
MPSLMRRAAGRPSCRTTRCCSSPARMNHSGRTIFGHQSEWFFWALLSASCAALKAIFAKIGIQGVDSDLATLVRTAVIIVVLALFVASAGKWSNPFILPGRTWLFLVLKR